VKSPGPKKGTAAKPVLSNRSTGPHPADDPGKNRRDADQRATERRRSPNKSADLPPNENLRKHADEAYGDTEIPERKED
jgi:hypothetical protein